MHVASSRIMLCFLDDYHLMTDTVQFCFCSFSQVTVGPSAEVKQGTTVVSEQVDDFGDVVDAPLDGNVFSIFVLKPYRVPEQTVWT